MNLSSRISRLQKRLSNKETIVIDDSNLWCSCGYCEQCQEDKITYNFYLTHGPATTGCTWEEYYKKQQAAGLADSNVSYDEYMRGICW